MGPSGVAGVAVWARRDPAAPGSRPQLRTTCRALVSRALARGVMKRPAMNRITLVLSFGLVAVTAFAGCAKKDGDSSGGGGGGGPPAAVKLDKLGLQVDVPGKVTVGDAIMAEGALLQGSGIGAMQVELAKAATPLAEAKSDADMYSPKNLKAEELADGWSLTFDNKGSMGTNYFVDVRRTIDGKNYKCSTTGADATQAAAVLTACKTLRK